MIVMNSNYSRIKKLYSKYLPDDFLTFMDRIWADRAEYKVLMARRMFNLNYALMKLRTQEQMEYERTDSLISNTAFLLYGRTIAEQYLYRKRFPRILICDDIMLHGRGVLKLLEQFTTIVEDYLKENHIEIDSGRLRLDINKAVRICVYAKNKETILIRDYYIYAEHVLPMHVLRDMSQQISAFLQYCGVANTSYVLSAKLPGEYLRHLVLSEDPSQQRAFVYRSQRQYFYARLKTPGIFETVRFQYPDESSDMDGILTSLVIYGDIENNKFEKLCEETASYLEQGVRYSQIANYLRQKNKALARPRAQLLSFIYSVLSMSDFSRQKLHLNGKEVYRILVDGDLDKIVSNFDNGDVFGYEMQKLCRDICMEESIGDPLWWFLEDAVQDLQSDDSLPEKEMFTMVRGPKKRSERRKTVIEAIEDIIYEVGIDAEYDAYRLVRNHQPFDVEFDGFDTITLSKFFGLIKRRNVTEAHCMGFLMEMMDSGIMSMNLEMQSIGDGSVYRHVLKAGELSTYILPRRFSVFIPALAYVERHCEQTGGNLRYKMGLFIDYLYNFCYEEKGKPDLRDVEQIKTLLKKKSLLIYIYSTGQKFQDWDIDLQAENRYLPGRPEDENGFTEEEEEIRKHHYLYCARQFLTSHV